MAAKERNRSFVGTELEESVKLAARRTGSAGQGGTRDAIHGAGLVACG